MQQKTVTILMADDDPEDLELIEDAFLQKKSNASLHKVMSGTDALNYLESRTDQELPALIILDYNMPDLNGVGVLSELKKQPRYHQIPKIVLSTSNAPLHIEECRRNGAADYLVKPANMKELEVLIQKMLVYFNGNNG